MFFILSKILAFIITPTLWIVLCFLYAYLTKKERLKKKFFKIGLILLLFFSNGFILDEAFRLWEIPATKIENVKQYEYGIVLGGMSVYDPQMDRAQFYRGVDRLIQTIELYRRGKIKKIVFTGGSGRILHPEMKEGNYINRYMIYMGIPKEDFIIESESNNTHENAVFTKKILDEKNIKGKFLLITSAFHMRRSVGCFTKAGFDVDTYSTDRFSGPRKFELDHLLLPTASAINEWSNLIHEIVGYLVYKMKGYA